MNHHLELALSYAQRGWRVFPLHGISRGRCTCCRSDCSSAGKHPILRGGFHGATSDVGVIERWWRRWPSANIGIRTGVPSGIVVIDIDLPTAMSALDKVKAMLPVTLTGLTGGGGIHLVYASEDRDLRNSAGSLPGIDEDLPGIDLRANGGYVVTPPSIHYSGRRYEWLDPSRPLVPAPGWLQQEPRVYAPAGPVAPAHFEGDGTPYGLAVLRNELGRLRAAQVGTRNHQLNRSAFILAQLVAGGELRESAVRPALIGAALRIGLEELEARQTINSAFRAGRRQPRVAPTRAT